MAPLSASALIMSGRGNQAVHDAGWPEGTLAMANFESRIGWWEGPPFGGGESHFLFCGNTAGFQDALAVFAAIRAPVLDLVIHDGPYEDSLLKERVDWSFTVWVPANWHRLFNNPKSIFSAGSSNFRRPVDPPRLDVYIGGGGGVDLAKVKVPASLHVRDERASASGVDLSGGTVIQGEFYDMDTGKPVRGAQLVVDKVSWQAEPKPHWDQARFGETVSDASGRARMDKVPTGGIRVTVNADGYAPRQLSQHTLARAEYLKFTVELAKAASIRGTVTDTAGRPIKGAKVRTSTELATNGLGSDDGRHYEPPDEWSAVTDGEGRFELRGLPVGYAQLYATAEGYHFKDALTVYEVPATNVVLQLASAGSLHVAVTDRKGKPLSRYEGHEIRVDVESKGGSKVGSWGGGATVKDDGTFNFNNVPPGEYRITSRPNPSSYNRQYAPEQIITVTPGARASAKVVYE
jgi:protocatechuate 3,4-dioxygenase beta subunit